MLIILFYRMMLTQRLHADYTILQDDADLEAMITDADFFVDALFNSLGSHVSIQKILKKLVS